MSTTHTSSLFPAASESQILEGHFSSVGRDSSSFTAQDVHVTINHNHTPSTSESLASSSSPSPSPNPTNVPNAHHLRTASSKVDEIQLSQLEPGPPEYQLQHDVQRDGSESEHSLTVSSTSSPPNVGVNFKLEEYTFTTQGPNHDEYWQASPAYTALLNIQTGPNISRLPPSNYSGDNWNHYTNFNESPTYMLNGFSPDSASPLAPFGIPRSRSPLTSHIPPTDSDPTLSPLYSAFSELTLSTPRSTYMPSPIMPDLNNILVLEPIVTNGNGTSGKRLLNHREQLVQFRDVPLRASDGEFGPFLPQQMYKPHTTSDCKRYVEEVMLEAPIYFKTEHPKREGILLKDALHSRTRRLVDRDQVVFEGRGPSVSIRLEWPGYRQWSRQIPTKDFRSPPQPLTLAKLTKNIAKCVQRFIQDRKAQPMEEGSDPLWKIGEGVQDIRLEDLVLVSIHHVSLGSWQPHLRLVRPRASPRHGQQLGSHGQSMSTSRSMTPKPLPSITESSNSIIFSD